MDVSELLGLLGKRAPDAALARVLGPDDLRALGAPNAGLGTGAPQLQKMRHSHHMLARLIAEGKRPQEISLITGYDPAYISNISNNDPVFKDLVSHYSKEVEQVFVSVHERLAVLSINTVDELRDRLDTAPESFTNRELMELGELTLDRSGAGPSSTVNSKQTLTLVTPDVIAMLKQEIASRSNGKVLPHDQRPKISHVIEHEPLAESNPARGESEGTGLRTTSGQVLEKDPPV